MKHFLLLLIIIFSFQKAKSAGYDGYYVTNKNDTIYAKIFIPSVILFGDDKFHKVEVVDTANSKKVVFKPGEISCFVYFDGEKKFVFVTKLFGNELLFFERRIRNSNYSLYSYDFMSGTGAYARGQINLVIAKNDSSYVAINSEDNSKKTKEILKTFFSDPNTQQKIEEIFRYRAMAERDAINFVNYLNRQ